MLLYGYTATQNNLNRPNLTLHKKNIRGVLYYDFAKVFGKVPDQRLLKKSKLSHGISGMYTAGLRTDLWTGSNGLKSTAIIL